MEEKIYNLMKLYKVSFTDLSKKLSVSKETLTRKIKGKTDWTYQEIILVELFHIEDSADFFY